MYIPHHFKETRLEVLHQLIKQVPFCSLISQSERGLVANHLPLLLDTTTPPFGVLRGHVARANPVWKDFSDSVESLVIFQGPDSYISPSWYPGKSEHGKVVPTWNYIAVHVTGIPQIMDDRTWILNHICELSDTHEAFQEVPWKVSDAPKEFIDQMMLAIVGIEIPITSITGKWKASQNRSKEDQRGVITALKSQSGDDDLEMADIICGNLKQEKMA